MGGMRGAYRVLVEKYEGKMVLGRPRRRWRGNIKCIVKNWDETWTGLI